MSDSEFARAGSNSHLTLDWPHKNLERTKTVSPQLSAQSSLKNSEMSQSSAARRAQTLYKKYDPNSYHSRVAKKSLKVISTHLKKEVKQKTGEKLQSEILSRRETHRNFKTVDGILGTLSFQKMIQTIDRTHPRLFIQDRARQVPLCMPTGKLAESQISVLDEYGIGVSLYFKLVKSLVSFFLLCFVLSTPVLYIYSCGMVAADSTGLSQKFLAMFTLGNIGQGTVKCLSAEVSISNTLNLWCPSGTELSELKDMGLQNKGASFACPASTSQGSTISLDLNQTCSLSSMASSAQLKYQAFMEAFEEDCKGETNCDFSIAAAMWPEDCQPQIGQSQISNSDSLSQQEKALALESAKDAIGNNTLQVFATVECTSQEIDLRNGLGLASGSKESTSPISRDALGLVVVIIDILIMFYFLVAIWFIQYYVKVETERHRNLLFEISEFALYFGNLPKVSSTFTIDMLKSELWEHIEKVTGDYPQQIDRLKDSTTSSEIVDIQFAMSDYQFLDDVLQIKKLSKKIQKTDLRLKKLGNSNPSKENSLTTYKKGLLRQIDSQRRIYSESLKEMDRHNYPLGAFVTFRSMEGVERAKKAFAFNWLTKFFQKTLGCLLGSRKKVLFRKEWLKVEAVDEPDLIIWQNIGLKRRHKCWRRTVYLLYFLLMMIICFYSIVLLENASQEAESFIPDIACTKEVSTFEAELDAVSEQKNGNLHCFCQDMLDTKGSAATRDFQFPTQGDKHCKTWHNGYWQSQVLTYFIPLVIGLLNILFEIGIQLGSDFSRPASHTQSTIHAIFGISWIQFINLGLVFMFISFSWEVPIVNKIPAFLEGNYTDFSSKWYMEFGALYVQTMIIEIAMPHVIPMLQVAYFAIARCCDRGCTGNLRRSKKLIQADYESLYTGPEFMLDSRLAQIIAFTWVSFMFSTGLPMLFLVSAINFIIIYWVDKILILRFYRTPKNYNEKTITYTISNLKWSFLFHAVIGFIIISNEKLLGSDDDFNKEIDQINEVTSQVMGFRFFQNDRFKSAHAIVFLLAQIALLVINILETTIFDYFKKKVNKMKGRDAVYNNMEAISDDFYEEISPEQLIKEHQRSRSDQTEFLLKLHQLSGEAVQEKQPVYETFISRMSKKEQLIEAKILHLCELAELPKMPIEKSILKLKKSLDKVFQKKHYRMKSKVQSYDIRDCSEYFGVLELEKLLKEWNGKSFVLSEFNSANRASIKKFQEERGQNLSSELFTESDFSYDDEESDGQSAKGEHEEEGEAEQAEEDAPSVQEAEQGNAGGAEALSMIELILLQNATDLNETDPDKVIGPKEEEPLMIPEVKPDESSIDMSMLV